MSIDAAAYRDWIERFDTLDDTDTTLARELAQRLRHRPTFDVVMPVFDPPEAFLVKAIDSVRRQLYPEWTLCILDDASTVPHVAKVLTAAAAEDSRIRVARASTNGGIAAATNGAIAMGGSEFVTFLDHDDVLAPHALLLIAAALEKDPRAMLVHGDMDALDGDGRRASPLFKPEYDHELLLGYNAFWGTLRRSLLEEIGGMRLGFPGSADYDLILRAVERITPQSVLHVPHVIHHWRMVPASFSHTKLSVAVDSAHRAVLEHCARLGVEAEVTALPGALAVNRVRAVPRPAPRVTLAVEGGTEPSRAAAGGRLLDRTAYPAVELASTDGSGGASIGAFRNEVARLASTELLAFVHVRLTPRAPDWLVEMVSHFAHDRCAAVGARVVAPDGRVEQCGVLLGVVETPDQSFPVARGLHGAADGDPGHQCRGRLSHGASALAGTAIVVRTSTVLALGGFDETLVDAASVDLDFTLRARRQGGTLITCPAATFDASESGPWFQDSAERALLVERFAALAEEDPFYSPNLTSTGTDFSLASPPRTRFPWRT